MIKNGSLFVFYFFFSCLLSGKSYALPSNAASQLSVNKTSNSPMTAKSNNSIQLSDFEKQLAAKMALDIRYFCSEKPMNTTGRCLEPVTELPKTLADAITTTGIGSVVLFAENLSTTKQIIQLTHDLQAAAVKSDSQQPLIISIDQEGGRVVRLPQATSFAGNMAIGATYQSKGIEFATQTSMVIAKELMLLGINNNYAPVVDVNTNAMNPVINTRSFGEDPKLVAELGAAVVNGLQNQGIMATLKHFPGHGDTHIDSHLGLPLVEHDLATIESKDLTPFEWAIKHSDPAMIMTAHIQYPALDNSTIANLKGEKIIRPATMSRKILTDLLRNNMGYNGIIATDALDMAGIAHYFNEVTAVVETFVAGADLAVMPFKIRKVEDIDKFKLFVKAVAEALQQKINKDEFSIAEVKQSVQRINSYKRKYIALPEMSLDKRVTLAEQYIAQEQHLLLEQALADNAVVSLIENQDKFPVDVERISRIHLFVLTWQEFRALKAAIIFHWQSLNQLAPQISATVVAERDAQSQIHQGDKLAKADLIIATVDTKIASAVDIGGAEDVLTQAYVANKQGNVSYEQLLAYQLQQAKQRKVASMLIAKGSPYLLTPYTKLADSILVTFDDRIYNNSNDIAYSPGYQTSIAIMLGKQKALGVLPVSLPKYSELLLN
ncbi:glycoside hydrolase family 3 protein [Colwellia sp. 4_MG-2023]|uniref:glycoside hydrolase family 3 protein n=1 Tax=unclassified Colwellia TaxID=196834 RepID=UPI0026E12879|nr:MULTISPECIES: glycoside hydrolase family 3 protein [unclassified Colwellia]MDO6506075.1 glycoside hydrolase family 3 protein [Colwellia sp. 5_MG-2023]MDO6554865.1 glycoside hydrolase family 3 protein [Colwellia sp. 4_MG-2023]